MLRQLTHEFFPGEDRVVIRSFAFILDVAAAGHGQFPLFGPAYPLEIEIELQVFAERFSGERDRGFHAYQAVLLQDPGPRGHGVPYLQVVQRYIRSEERRVGKEW